MNQTAKTNNAVLYLFLYIPVIWAALLIAQSLGGGLPELINNLTVALDNPFDIHWTDKSAASILACSVAYMMGLLLYTVRPYLYLQPRQHPAWRGTWFRHLGKSQRNQRHVLPKEKQAIDSKCTLGIGHP